MSNNPRVENVFIGGCGPGHDGEDHPELDMFSEWIKERVSGGHVMAARPGYCGPRPDFQCMHGQAT